MVQRTFGSPSPVYQEKYLPSCHGVQGFRSVTKDDTTPTSVETTDHTIFDVSFRLMYSRGLLLFVNMKETIFFFSRFLVEGSSSDTW